MAPHDSSSPANVNSSEKDNPEARDRSRMLKFIADDAVWHYERRKQILTKDPTIKKYFKPYAPSALFLLAVVAFRTWVIVQVGNYISSMDSYVSQYFAMMFYCLIFDQFLMHSGLSFAHEHSHNLILESPTGLKLIDAMLDWHAMSFADVLKYVYSHSRFHHPNLGDKSTDSELENKSLPDTPWNLFLYFGHLFIPGLVLLDITTKQKSKSKMKGSREFQVPKTWASRKYTCIAASVASVLFHAYHGGLLLKLWSMGMYVGPYNIWRKGQSIAEHITNYHNPAPTYTSPSWWSNVPFFNTGYHDEHHTFPMVPWIHLPKLKAAHPEIFRYDQHTPYEVLWLKWMLQGCPNYRDPDLNDHTGKVWYDIDKKAYKSD